MDSMHIRVDTSRRHFLKSSALLAGGLVIGFVVPGAKRFARAEEQAAQAAAKLPEPNAFIRIGSDNSITVLLAHSEMGQGIWTTLPMLIAEELDADWNSIKVEHAPVAPQYGHVVYGLQMTGGSSTTWSEFDRYRQAGALARKLLIQAGAQRFGVNEAICMTEHNRVLCGDASASYGELAAAAALLPTPTEVTLKSPAQWTIIGKPTKRLDSPEKINGSARFGMDVQFPGLMTALVLRAPVFGAKVKSYSSARALAVPGVRKVVKVPSGIAVIADHYWAAKQGRDALKVSWDQERDGKQDSAALLAEYRRLATTQGAVAAQQGDAPATLAAAHHTIKVEYLAPFLAHAPMEPLNCAVRIGKDDCEVWTGTQMQGGDIQAVARITGLKQEQIRIHTQFLGGGFGRRATPSSDFVAEATQVAKAAGMPVKTVWTREDDVKGGYYRPFYLHQAQVALGEDGMPLAWQHVSVGQSIMRGTPFEAVMVKDGVDPTSVEGIADSPYLKAIPHHRVDLHSPQNAIPILWWRSVGHSHTAFVVESLVDEMAHAAGQEPLAYRQQLLKDSPRHLRALNLAAEQAGWNEPAPPGIHRGLAVHESFGSYVAQVLEISMDNGLKVERVVCAIDCGLAVNPESVRAQVESAVAFGLGAALKSVISFKDGLVQQSNFHDYQVLRMSEMPRVEVHIVPSEDKMGGVGEPGVPPVAPALANAIFAATGKRIRSLPIANQLA